MKRCMLIYKRQSNCSKGNLSTFLSGVLRTLKKNPTQQRFGGAPTTRRARPLVFPPSFRSAGPIRRRPPLTHLAAPRRLDAPSSRRRYRRCRIRWRRRRRWCCSPLPPSAPPFRYNGYNGYNHGSLPGLLLPAWVVCVWCVHWFKFYRENARPRPSLLPERAEPS